MKKTRLILLLTLLLVCLTAAASAASLMSNGPSGQVYIGAVTDAEGNTLTDLTDGSTVTTWTQSISSQGADLSITLYSATVGEIWIRSGHCYSQQYYNHFDRPDVIAVTLHYPANRYTTTSVTYRYRMSDAYRPNTVSSTWNNGYQRLLLPQAISGVTRIDLTIESVIAGYGNTGATITDLLVTQGSHVSASSATRATATPKPYVVYVTPTPTPYNPDAAATPIVTRDTILLTPEPTKTPLVQLITPQPTKTQQVTLITPVPQPTATPETEIVLPSLEYPSQGILAPLLKTAATRSGPDNKYDEPGSFFQKGTMVNVISKGWDESNELWWFQIEFCYRGEWMRAYTPSNRIDLDPDLVPAEVDIPDSREVLYDQRVYFGPGENFKMYKVSMLYKGSKADIYAVEEIDGVLWAQIHYHDYAVDEDRRGWVPMECLSTWPFAW